MAAFQVTTEVFIACVDGLKGFPEAIESVFPQSEVQLCIVHLVRHSPNYVGWKQRKEVAADLNTIYSARPKRRLNKDWTEFSLKWEAKFPTVARSWRSNWARVIPFFAHPPEIRKVIYTTNAIESLNMSLRKVTKARGSFPNNEVPSVCNVRSITTSRDQTPMDQSCNCSWSWPGNDRSKDLASCSGACVVRVTAGTTNACIAFIAR
jgi:transposase-like protein